MRRCIVIGAAGLLLGAGSASADLVAYSNDFESLDPLDAAALTNDGWAIFGNVYDPGGGYLYGYGPFGAPNGNLDGGGYRFSAIATGEGGAAQGNNQISIFSDYNNGDHANGNWIEANFYREWTVGAANVGQTWTFQFDVKHGDLVAPSTSLAFIKTLDPNNGYALTNFITYDTTNTPATWDTQSVSLFIDAGLAGQIFQIGFANTATNYDASGQFYDNINLVPAPSGLALLGVGGLLASRRRR